jgi:hypothetical protein
MLTAYLHLVPSSITCTYALHHTYIIACFRSRPLSVKGSSDGSAAAPPNMHIWHMPSGKLAASYQQKVFKNDSIQWSGDGIPSYIQMLFEMSFT